MVVEFVYEVHTRPIYHKSQPSCAKYSGNRQAASSEFIGADVRNYTNSIPTPIPKNASHPAITFVDQANKKHQLTLDPRTQCASLKNDQREESVREEAKSR